MERKITVDNQFDVAFLYDGGWRHDDVKELMAEFGLTANEAEAICEKLYDIEIVNDLQIEQ